MLHIEGQQFIMTAGFSSETMEMKRREICLYKALKAKTKKLSM